MWVGSLSNVVADLKVAEWVSVDERTDEKAGRKVQVNGGLTKGRGKVAGLFVACIQGATRRRDKLAEAWGDLVRSRWPLAGMANLVAQ